MHHHTLEPSEAGSDSCTEQRQESPQEPNRQLFFGKGPYGITELEVRSVFGEFGPVMHVQMFRDRTTGRTTGCGVVALETHEQACEAMAALDGVRTWPGSPLMMVVQWRDPEVQSKKRREAEALERQQGLDGDDDKDNDKLFFSRVPPHVTEEQVKEFFTEQYNKPVVDVDFFRNAITQESKGFGIITFDCHETAVAALNELHDVYVWPGGFGDTMLLKWAQPPERRRRADGVPPHAGGGPRLDGPPPGCDRDAVRLFIGDIPRQATKAEVAEFFSQYGKIVDLYMVKDHNTNTPKGIAYLWFAQRAAAERCAQTVDQQWYLPGHKDAPQPLRVYPANPRQHGGGGASNTPRSANGFSPPKNGRRQDGRNGGIMVHHHGMYFGALPPQQHMKNYAPPQHYAGFAGHFHFDESGFVGGYGPAFASPIDMAQFAPYHGGPGAQYFHPAHYYATHTAGAMNAYAHMQEGMHQHAAAAGFFTPPHR